ncbi:MAG: translation initiation factor IF-3 [Candidatus Pelagibacter sp. TMED273]|nr:MAG: translation initiation factor IF-3 [Candidatus Pelagibacter sp. TMED273]
MKINKSNKGLRINEQIKSDNVRLIGSDGDQLGIVPLQSALIKADDIGLDLVEISPNTNPPVCKILDYGKYIYEKQKLEKKNKKKQHVIHVKEIRVRPNTGDHDLLTKLSRAKKFLEAGDKVKITVMYRGREMARQDMGVDTLNRVVDILDDFAEIDKQANMEGRRLSLILSPK